MNSPNNQVRFNFLDQLRGIAVILMIIFHFCYDLSFFSFYDMNYPANPYWYALPRIIVFLFLICVGMGLFEAHFPDLKLKKFGARFLKIAIWAIIISMATYFLFPDRWIYFGTLHCIAIASLVSLPFLRFPIWGALIGLYLVVSDFIFDIHLPWITFDHPSMDYIPLFPWWGFTLIGIFIAYKGWHRIKVPSLPSLEWLGKHALAIYIIHQPLFFGLTYLFYWLSKKS